MNNISLKIPKILHFIWLGNLPVPEIIQSWYKNHQDWNIKIWRDKDISLLKLQNRRIYNLAKKRYNQKSDIARLEILYKYGGVYVDADIFNIKNINNLLDNELFLFQEKKNLISNSVIGCTKNNQIIRKLIRKMCVNYDYNTAVWKSTGPGFITTYLTKKNIVSIPKSNVLIDIVSLSDRITIYPYYYVNMMKDIIKDSIFNPVSMEDLKHMKDDKDERYIKYNNIHKENIFGVQLWMGGRTSNYNKQIDLQILLTIINNYIDRL